MGTYSSLPSFDLRKVWMSGTTFTWDGILQVMFRRNLCCQWQINFIDAQWMNQLWNIVSKLLWAVDRQCQTTTLTIWCLIPAIEEVERWQFGIERELAQYQCPWLGVHVWLCHFLLHFVQYIRYCWIHILWLKKNSVLPALRLAWFFSAQDMGHACLKFDIFFVAVWVRINERQPFDKEKIPFISTEGALRRPLT